MIQSTLNQETVKPKEVVAYKDITHNNGRRETYAEPEQHPSQMNNNNGTNGGRSKGNNGGGRRSKS